jgi:hypothetical protein
MTGIESSRCPPIICDQAFVASAIWRPNIPVPIRHAHCFFTCFHPSSSLESTEYISQTIAYIYFHCHCSSNARCSNDWVLLKE